MSGTRWTDDTIALLRAYAASGLSIRQAALRLGRSFGSVLNAKQRYGVSFNGGRGGAPLGNRNSAKPHRRIHDI
jgi:transposase